jgi:hypothetical protein
MNKEIVTFNEVLRTISEKSNRAWVYLPKNSNWSLNSKSAVLESDEVAPEHEDEPDAGVPELAKSNNLMQVLPVVVLQDIVSNARAQKADVTPEELFKAFDFYHKNDAFLKLDSA